MSVPARGIGNKHSEIKPSQTETCTFSHCYHDGLRKLDRLQTKRRSTTKDDTRPAQVRSGRPTIRVNRNYPNSPAATAT